MLFLNPHHIGLPDIVMTEVFAGLARPPRSCTDHLRPSRGRITASDAQATDAVHEFLRYQIREHATGDPLTIK
jgi:hypothetical protein